MTKILVSCSFIALLIFSSVQATKMGVASIIAWPANKQLFAWQHEDRLVSQDLWPVLRADLHEALLLDTGNPDLIYKLGLSYEGEFAYYPPGDPFAEEFRKVAKDYYQQALTIRTVWPYYWIDLALVKYRLNEIDEDFYAAFQNAMLFGPWEPGVQRVIVNIGLHHWENFSQEIQYMIVKMVRSGVLHRNSADDMLKLVARYNRLDLACNMNSYRLIEDPDQNDTDSDSLNLKLAITLFTREEIYLKHYCEEHYY